ncbi:MAG: hypothetical protein KAS32_03535 [Candidatus Peribacteraceae bacterium]|nr:hypothetical protein [Candidatus Peribacteraceae bacterium]
MSTQFKFKRGTEEKISETLLGYGEPAYAIDTKRFFIGDGSTKGGFQIDRLEPVINLTKIYKSDDYEAGNNQLVAVDTSSAPVTITLPPFPQTGWQIRIIDAKRTFDSNNVILDKNGSTIQGLDANYTLDEISGSVLYYGLDGTAETWFVISNAGERWFEGGVEHFYYNYTKVDTDSIANVLDSMLVDTTTNQVTITLPTTPNLGDKVQIQDFAANFEINNCIIDAGSNQIDETGTTLLLTDEQTVVTLTYDINEDGTYGWTTAYGRDNKDNIGRGGAGGIGDLTSEDIMYESLLMHSTFSECYYDIFRKNSLVVPSGSPTPSHSENNTSWSGSSGSVLTTYELVAYDGTSTIFRFYPHIEADDAAVITGEYAIDGTNWISMTFDEIHHIPAGFDSLVFRFTWGGTGEFTSFGTLYLNNDYVTNTATRMFELFTVVGNQTQPYDITLPNNAYYVVDGKSLEVYRNGIRQIIGTHYEETDENTIRFIVDLTDTDIIMFTEFFGYVDLSTENIDRVDRMLGLESPFLPSVNSLSTESITDQGGGSNIQFKVIDIGDWDMDSQDSVTVAHSVDLTKIIDASVVIRDDSNTTRYSDGRGTQTSGLVQLWVESMDSTNVELERLIGSSFDGTGYNDTSYNRGWITIRYTE